MCLSQILTNLAINLFAGILIFLFGLFWPIIPKSFRQFLLRRFWGKGVLGQSLGITYGTLKDSRLCEQDISPYMDAKSPRYFRYVKTYHDGRAIALVGPWGYIVSECEIRSASYIINAVSTYRKLPVAVLSDTTAFESLDRTFVALGSGSSNEISDLILRAPGNEFLEFGQQGTTILDKKTGREFVGFKEPVRRDYGIILKLPNLRFPGHFFFLCAGLGEWGTSGATWYLATKWRDLLRKFGNNPFGVVVEVEIGVDNSAVQVFPE